MRTSVPAATSALVRAFWAVLRSPSGRLTLDQLRSDLSHETAAKLARLSGIVQEWRGGRFQAGDPADVEAVLADLERIYLRHARLAGARPGTFARLVGLLGLLASARRSLRLARDQAALAPEAADELAGLVGRLGTGSQGLVEALSRRYGARFDELLRTATEEVRRESSAAGPQAVPVLLESAREVPVAWVPRGDAAPWADVLRNLVRNAVQATEDRQPGPAAGSPSPAVTVRVLALPGRSGTAVEVLDEGVGMDAAAVEGMWRAGRSTHGHGHGQGLTESKRAFVEARAGLEVRSAAGVGSCVRLALEHRDVAIAPPPWWALPPVALPLLAVLACGTLGLSPLLKPAFVDLSVDATDARLVRARDARGAVVWQRSLDEDVLPNYLGNMFTPAFDIAATDRHLVLDSRWPWGRGVVLATKPAQGPGHVWRLGTDGATRWKHTLRWTPPRVPHTGELKCMFQALTPWDQEGRQAIALNVRDADWGATAIQFVTPGGDSLGTYYHPGHLEYFTSADVDGDGRVELVLVGKNNRAREDRSFLAADPGEDYIESVVMLEPPQVNGQAYPYTGWTDVPRAAEKAYLLLPPLRRGPASLNESSTVWRLSFGAPTAPGVARVELQLRDGRVYHLDAHLRPLSCGVGDNTLADSLAPTRALGPLLYLRGGRRELIDLPIVREP